MEGEWSREAKVLWHTTSITQKRLYTHCRQYRSTRGSKGKVRGVEREVYM